MTTIKTATTDLTPPAVANLPPTDPIPFASLAESSVSAIHTIATSSLTYGSKYEGLVQVNTALAGASSPSVPTFFGFTDAQIKKLLSSVTKTLWDEICKLDEEFQKTEGNELRNLLSQKLDSLPKSVEEDILSAVLPMSEEQWQALAMLHGKRLMVRSSSNEDTLAAVNAGGNLSLGGIAATERDLRWALAKVVASYFDRRSLNKRSAFENPFEKPPLCSVLVMEEIAEDAKDPLPTISGVMMTHKTAWIPRSEGRVSHISASWGFGGGVVSGTIPCDEWVLTEEEPYATIRIKTHRQIVLPNGETKEVPNALNLRETPVLSEEQLKKLQTVAERLERHFNQPMDVEFVIKGDVLYVVQARPIQAPEASDPTFLDSAQISNTTQQFHCETLLPGESRVLLDLSKYAILFAKTLEEAQERYISKLHKAVIISTPPESGNTHAEVNFSSQRPPVPCMFLPFEDGKTFLAAIESAYDIKIALCPQTGLLVLAKAALIPRSGLFLHPAKFPVSVVGKGKGIQGHSTHPEMIGLQRLLKATPEELSANLGSIKERLQKIFAEIFSRIAVIGNLEEAAKNLREKSFQVLKAMQIAKKKNDPVLLSFHAAMLRQILGQSGQKIIGGHSISGLETASCLPPHIQDFIQTHRDAPILCELALLGRKAFDESVQRKWLDFLKSCETPSSQQWEQLLDQIQRFDSMGMASIWFAFQTTPKIETLLIHDPKEIEFFCRCTDFASKFAHLSAMAEHISSEKELTSSWDALEEETEAFLVFSKEHPQRTPLQELELSKLLIGLIQLWDLHIKTVKTSKVLPPDRANALFHERINAFAEFGLEWGKDSSIPIKDALTSLLDELKQGFSDRISRYGKSFSVQHWLVPRGEVYVPIQNDDQRLTVIHQNLLQAAGLLVSNADSLLPSSLAAAKDIFQEENPSIVKRFGNNTGTFFSFTDESVTVTINVPLNLHSFVVALRQKKNDELEITAYWRGSDNHQSRYLNFLKLFSSLSGIALKSYQIQDADLKVLFSATGEKQMRVLSRAIHSVNSMSLHSNYFFYELVNLLHPSPVQKDLDAESKETQNLVLATIWDQFETTGEMPVLGLDDPHITNYLAQTGLMDKVALRVIDELVGALPKSLRPLRNASTSV